MKIIAYDRFKPGVTMETVQPYLRDEVSNVWRLWKAGIVRENYARADEPGVVIVFECARRSLAALRLHLPDRVPGVLEGANATPAHFPATVAD